MAADDHGDDRALLPFEGDEDGDGDGASGRLIRRQWHDGRWFFSVIDVVGLLTDSPDPGNYWASLKRRVQDEGFVELVTRCHRLKMRSLDGKMRETDAADVETMLRLVQSIPSPKAEPVKQWLARVGTERLDEIASGDLLAGLSEEQRRLFIRGQLAEHNRQLADAAAGAGVVTARDIAARKGLRRGETILDWMGSTELAANLFRSTQTEEKLRRERITGKDAADATHHAVGREVRETIQRLGGAMPEELPTPTASIQQLRRHEAKQAERQPSLFPEAETPTGGMGDE